MKYLLSVLLLSVGISTVQAGGNHYDPNNRAIERAQSSAAWHRQWKQNYGHNKSRKEWHKSMEVDGLQPVVTAIDYSTRNLYLFNYETDDMFTVSQSDIVGWRWDLPLQHTAVNADASIVWVTTDATVNEPPRVIRLDVLKLDWEKGDIRLVVKDAIEVGPVGKPATLPFVEAVPGSTQEIATWIQASMSQVHAFTFLPFSEYMYTTEYPTSDVHILKNDKRGMELVDTINIEGWTEQTHGIMFNSSGTTGLGTGYFYDNHVVDVYKPNRVSGELETVGQIELAIETESGEKFVAPFFHLFDWVDERYAYTVTMQHDRTSLTPSDVDGIVGPSVWLIDTVDMTATKVLDQAMSAVEGGIFRSGSDISVVNNKLYIAEEDSVRQENVDDARDGYISVFDITDRLNPVFLKRLEPGVDLPVGYNIAHTIGKTKDNRFIIVGSWHSGYVIKVDVYDDTVAHVWGPDDNLVMPHGIFVSAGLR